MQSPRSPSVRVGERRFPRRQTMSRPGVAALLSFFIPGIGQIYNGCILRGLFWLVVTPGLWIGTAGLLGWICHLIAAATAFTYAENREKFSLPAWRG
jgi:TM2 domain-containing membrane protein YozV